MLQIIIVGYPILLTFIYFKKTLGKINFKNTKFKNECYLINSKLLENMLKIAYLIIDITLLRVSGFSPINFAISFDLKSSNNSGKCLR